MAWESLCTPKGMGGLGFRDLRLFNIALLRKQLLRPGLDGKLAMDGRVRDLWRPNSCEWDGDQVKDLYGEEISPHICALPISFYQVCHRRGTGDETIIHALRNCLKARMLEDATRLLDLKAFENLIMVSWNVWNSRNNALFHGKKEDARLIWERARTLGDDFRNFNLSHVAMNLRPPNSHRWVKLSIDVIKISVDATIHDTVVGIGIIERDSDDFVLGGHACDNNVARAIFETDCARLVNWFKFHRENISIFRFRLKNIFNLLDCSIEFEIEWVTRSSNRVADGLGKLTIDKRCAFSFDMEYPSNIHRLVVLTDAC
ncbi:hypothetical protein CXB51_025616 [Gossypium anomalum]|uniref:RNase H type-1 domain-containing protein n=1 Tax=Gossypium anomalum TaxID=47600 RepID=A0A8J6CMZ9_9ROSI|nr:hypothetical protein CXB51_025616 [Gossypium anomalum]